MTWPPAIAFVIAATALWGCAANEHPETCPQVPVASDATGLLPQIRFVRDCPDCPELAVVPSGRFTMGTTIEPGGQEGPHDSYFRLRLGPAHCVTISKPFAIARSEVSVGEWRTCQLDGACRHVPGLDGVAVDFPVHDLTWDDAQAYVRWLSVLTGNAYRLPSEAEWEYAARGGLAHPEDLPWADAGGHPGCVQADKPCPAHGGFRPVRSHLPNPFGLYDMTFNVAEWTEDCAHAYGTAPAGQGANLDGDCSLRVARGFQSGMISMRGRIWFRDFLPPSDPKAARGVGFRVVRNMGPQS